MIGVSAVLHHQLIRTVRSGCWQSNMHAIMTTGWPMGSRSAFFWGAAKPVRHFSGSPGSVKACHGDDVSFSLQVARARARRPEQCWPWMRGARVRKFGSAAFMFLAAIVLGNSVVSIADFFATLSRRCRLPRQVSLVDGPHHFRLSVLASWPPVRGKGTRTAGTSRPQPCLQSSRCPVFGCIAAILPGPAR